MDKRVAVAVHLRTDAKGEITPLAIEWHDGRLFEIARVEGRSRVADQATGEIGWRYDVALSSATKDEARRLYRFGPVWYVYRKSVL